MKISEFSVNRPITTLVIYIAVIVLGIYSLTKLAIDLIPDISFPVIAIFSDYPGASPQEVEENLTKIIENAASLSSNVKKVSSTSREGKSMVTVEYEWGTDMSDAAADLREKLDLVRDYLPDEASQPVIFKFDPSLIPVMIIVVEGKRDLKSLRYIADHDIKNSLEQIDGVAKVDVYGGKQRQIHVDIKRDLLDSFGISIDQVIGILRSENVNISGGEIIEGNKSYTLRTVGKFKSIEEIKKLVVGAKNGVPVYLEDIADVYDGYVKDRMYARVGLHDAVIMAVQKQSGTNTVQIANLVEKRIKLLKRELPSDIKITKFYSPADFIKKSINNVWQVALMGGVFAIFVLLIFLRNIPTTLVIGVSIPLSIITTFVFMYLFKLTLNMMSLGGLALGIGMLVDNSIVVLENIFRYREFGAKPFEAAKLGSQEMSNAIVASTLTTIAVFLPMVFFIKGLASELFKDLAFTVTFSLLSSLLVALTIIPMLTSRIRGVHIKRRIESLTDIESELRARGRVFRAVDGFYRRLLEWALDHKGIFLSIVIVIFGVSLFSIKTIGVEFMPQSDESFIQIELFMPIGTDLSTTEKTVNKIYRIIEKNVPERKTVFMQIGRSGQGIGVESPDRAEIWMTLVDVTKRKRSDKEIIEDLRKRIALIPGVTANFSTGGGPTTGSSGNLKVSILGYDLRAGKELAEKIKGIMEKVPNVKDVQISRKEGLPEYQIMVDRKVASLYGISASQIGRMLKEAVKGDEVTKVVIKGEEVGVLVKFRDEDVHTIDDLKMITVKTPAGFDVPLVNFLKIKKGFGPVKIEREKQQRVIYVNARVIGDVKGAVDSIKKGVSNIVIPPGFTISYGGSWEDLKETIQDLSMVMLLAIILVYLIMAALFESFFDPFIIMFTLPMTFIGVVWMHILTGTTFSAISGIGIVMLAGIVVNNGIILVDYTNLLRKRGYDLRNAVVLAGRTRLRPILMTMLTTVLGLIPMSFAFGSGSEMRTPMARTVIGGLLVSTLFTLVLIPVLYTIFETRRIKRREKRRKRAMGNG